MTATLDYYRLSALIAGLDALIGEQLNEIIHHPDFQALEARWRGVEYLTHFYEPPEPVVTKILNIGARELTKDLEKRPEFDQSEIFFKIYEAEFGTAGGKPYGLLVGDYEVSLTPPAESDSYLKSRFLDVDVLSKLSQVAAAAFAPFVTAVSPHFFGVDHFDELTRIRNLAEDLRSYPMWTRLRSSEDARFVGLVLPRFLLRLPYRNDGTRPNPINFEETVDESKHYLWGCGAFAFAGVVIRAFQDSRWFANIRGAHRDPAEPNKGRVVPFIKPFAETDSFEVDPFELKAEGVTPIPTTEFIMTDSLDKLLNDLGFIALSSCQRTSDAVFNGNASVQAPRVYDDEVATTNARISSMLQYVLCVSRFAHYVKVNARNWIGSVESASALQHRLNDWVNEYRASGTNLKPQQKARFPLSDAEIQLWEDDLKPGKYRCRMWFKPHYQLDAVAANVNLTTELTAPNQK